uniref:Uncharacterized protein n=1 Tax=Anguilla anguilla TaxID=7936 RepID=A0A0E9U165_ANGAN
MRTKEYLRCRDEHTPNLNQNSLLFTVQVALFIFPGTHIRTNFR